MDLFILRHGLAEERDRKRYPDDGLRPLTIEGRKKLKKIAGRLKGFGYKFDLVLTSPLVRAGQTAEIAAGMLGIEDFVRQTAHLSPDGDPRKLVDEVVASRKDRVLLVGHEPYLSGLISVLLSGRSGLPINLKKGGFCHLSVGSLRHGSCAALDSLLAPRQMIRN
ncbi:MAG TPA: phosphohistidine phosphatase SixA [candidate division Zixibacteria bacterium]|jgi:phosphohistidine phosphatase|nr:phosphohistidine phosphatase SixA [candidate division Zixibacteria bacterium]